MVDLAFLRTVGLFPTKAKLGFTQKQQDQNRKKGKVTITRM
jgi:hypothetical protein